MSAAPTAGKRRGYGVRSSALENASAIIDPARARATPTQLVEMSKIRLDLDPENPRDLALRPEDLGGIADDDPQRARKQAELEGIQELATAIRMHGLIHPIEVYRYGESFVLSSGQRRYYAHLLLGEPSINASVLIQKPRVMRARQYVENESVVRLSLAQRVAAIGRILAESGFDQAETKDQVAHLMQVTGMQQASAYRYLAVHSAPESLRNAVLNGVITGIKDASELARLPAERIDAAVAAYIAGTPLEALTAEPVGGDGDGETPPPVEVTRRGRPATAISLGRVTKPNVVRTIITTMLGEEPPDIDWNDYRAAAKAWQEFVKKLEEKYG